MNLDLDLGQRKTLLIKVSTLKVCQHIHTTKLRMRNCMDISQQVQNWPKQGIFLVLWPLTLSQGQGHFHMMKHIFLSERPFLLWEEQSQEFLRFHLSSILTQPSKRSYRRYIRHRIARLKKVKLLKFQQEKNLRKILLRMNLNRRISIK